MNETRNSAPSHKRRNIIIAIISAFVLLAAGVGLGYLFWKKETPTQNTTTSNQQQSDRNNIEPQLQPEDVTKKIKDDYASRYTLLDLETNNQPKDNEMSIRLSKRAPAHKVEGFDFYTDYDGGSTLDLMAGPVDWNNNKLPSATDTKLRTEVAAVYTGFGMEKAATRGSLDLGNAVDVYTGKGLICTIETPTTANSSTSASCGLIALYKAEAEKIKPLAAVTPNTTSSTFLGGLKLSDSQVAGYQKASLQHSDIAEAGGGVAHFYKKGSDAWTYFTGAQQVLLCSQYNTVDLRSAFKGESCDMGNGTISTVQ